MDLIKKLEWEIYSKTNRFKAVVMQAKEIIAHAIALNLKFAIQWSGGKDSTAMTHLIKTMSDFPIIIQFDDCDWEETKPYVNDISQKFNWKIHDVYPDFSIWEGMIKSKPAENSVCATSHYLTRDGFIKPIQKKVKELNCKGRFMGLRAEESKGREKNYKTRGSLYQLKNKEYVCTPLINWTARDVFSYLVLNNIEINPCYLKNKFRQPEDIRLAWAVPTASVDTAIDIEHIKYYYPKHYKKLKEAKII